ncbi:MAG: T9SS type A sorting domain-containing protein [Candidatus Zixiibacteriota bacterium]
MSKRFHTLMVVMAIMLVPSVILAGAGHQFAVGKATAKDNLVVVPLVVTNEANLAAMDIPLKFSEGVTLREVEFAERVSYFDLKVANIDNEKSTVIIGLLPQITATAKPDLEAGTGPVANLVFEVTDPNAAEVTLEAIETSNPGHYLMYVYHDYDQNGVPHIRVERPEFEPMTVAFSGVIGSSAELPTVYALDQNYPNPFNPTTEIAFDLPAPSHVELTVYNILGQKVETLVDEQREAGRHVVTWDASGYSSGVYFYRISAMDFSATKKMLLLK